MKKQCVGNYKEVGARNERGYGLIGKKPNLGFGLVAYRKRALHNKWVYKLKEEDGGKKQYKDRLVVKGFVQKKVIDFDEIFYFVVKMTSIITILSLVVVEELHLK